MEVERISIDIAFGRGFERAVRLMKDEINQLIHEGTYQAQTKIISIKYPTRI